MRIRRAETSGRRAAMLAAYLGAWLLWPAIASADFQFKKGSFTKSAAAAPVSQPVSGLGFRPKAVIFFWTRQTIAETFNPEIQAGYGFATGPLNERAVAIASQDGSLGGNSGKGQWQSSSIVLFGNANPTPVAQAELVSLDADGFTLNWTLNEARADIIQYVALGGSDLSRATVGTFTKNAGTGNDPITGVGFQPDFLMLLGAHMTPMDNQTTEAQLTLGFASGPTERASVTVQLEDAAGLGRNTCVQQRSDGLYLDLNDNGSPCTEDTRFDLVSFDPDGFTVDRQLNNGSGQLVHYLALKGGRYRVGSFNKSTLAAPVDDPVAGVGFPPVGLLLASKNLVTNVASEPQGRISFGAADGGTEGATWWHDADGLTSDANERTSITKVAVHATSPATLNAEANLKSLDGDGFTLNWTTNNAVAQEMLYVAFGASPRAHQFKKGTLSKSGAVGLQKVVSVGFRPKALLFFWTRQSSLDLIEPNVQAGYGFATGPGSGQASIAVVGDDAVGASTTDTGRWHSPEFPACAPWPSCAPSFASILMLSDGTPPTLAAEGRLTQMLNNGFEIDWVTNDGRSDLIHYVALGGTDITNALVDGFDAGAATGNLSVTTGFQPDFVMFLSPNLTVSSSTDGKTAFGFASGPTEQGAVAVQLEDGFQFGGPDSCVEQYSNRALVDLNNACSAEDKRLNLVSFDPTGFTVNREVNAGAVPIHYLALRGGKYKVGAFNKSTGAAPATQDVTGVGFWPDGLLLASGNHPTLPGIQPESRISFGAGDAVKAGAAWWHCKDNVSTSDCNERTSTTKVAVHASQTTLNAEADLVGFLFDGFRLNWTTNSATADQILYVAFGPTVPTAVELFSFTASPANGAVDLAWATASELQNLGFHLYRADAEDGPYTRITSSLIPGLGSSPTGQSYSYQDSGLQNGRTYFYKLEDVETTGRTEMHGPVSATPTSAQAGGGTGSASGSPGTAYGEPSSVLREVERSPRHVVLELLTGGFVATPVGGGRVRLTIRGFESASKPGEPELPMRRALVEAVAGRKVHLASVEALAELRFPGLRPTTQGAPGVEVDENGVVLPSEEKRREGQAFHRAFPSESVLLLGASFQGETKKAEVHLFPLRWDGSGLTLSRRLRVRLEFSGTEVGETSRGGSRGRQAINRGSTDRTGVLAQLMVRERGLYRVGFDDLFTGTGRQPRGVSVSRLRLSRQGEDVPFHVEPATTQFGPGSSLYFLSEGSSLNPYGDAAYELATNGPGVEMEVESLVSTSRAAVAEYFPTIEREENRYYSAGLLEAPDLWLWDLVVSPGSRTLSFTVDALSMSSSAAHLSMALQGASDFEGIVDHHVRIGVNGVVVGEGRWDGRAAKGLELEVPSGALREGANALEIEDVGDTGASYSMVFLNRFSLSYPRRLVAVQGNLEGHFQTSGVASIEGALFSSILLDTTGAPRWLRGMQCAASGVCFPVLPGKSYLLASSVLRPEVRLLEPSSLKSATNQADYLLLAPQAFLEAASPLLEFRQSQGLTTRAVSLEEVFAQFGHGEISPLAIKKFLEYAYQSWAEPSPRYVLLLGDASYDPKNYLGTGVKDWLPGFPVKTSYLWTVSDPAYASVNGSDLLPDIAIGRLPAGSLDEARRLVQKTLSYENGGGSFDGSAVLVADNADQGGNFERDANEIASTLLASRNPRKIYYSQEGANTRTKIKQAFDEGTSLMSYMGHGGTAIWASENIFNYQDVNALALQPQQPLLLTLNCLNGFFHFPPLNSLSEALLKAEGKGVIGAFSPSGLSINDAAHLFHKALLREILSGRHERLGDAVLAAQESYADSGAFPELLSIYNLLGDPALRIN